MDEARIPGRSTGAHPEGSRRRGLLLGFRRRLARWFPPERRAQAFVGALLVGFGILGLVRENLRLRRSLAREPVAVVAVRRSLPPGSRLRTEDLERRWIPAPPHPKLVRWEERASVLGQQLREGVGAGEPLLWSVLSPEVAASERLAHLVPPGERAVAIPVDGLGAVGYHVEPGDRVDLFVVLRRAAGRAVVPILQNVTVIGVGTALLGEPVPERYGQVVVSVTPREAEALLLAQELGRISLLLRRQDDLVSDPEFPVLDEERLLASELRRELQRRRDRRAVRVIRGS